MSDKLDIDSLSRHLFERGRIAVEPEEHPDDRSTRIRRPSQEFVISQSMNGLVILGLIAAAFFSGYLIFSDDQIISDWARTLFSAIVAGGVSFFTGREVGRANRSN
ncbi:MAG: hypothetical protein H0T75_12790 [Rhizobiales bacterium]|nr:hypothetical protein [Hyphomicrobiales bacterium]